MSKMHMKKQSEKQKNNKKEFSIIMHNKVPSSDCMLQHNDCGALQVM